MNVVNFPLLFPDCWTFNKICRINVNGPEEIFLIAHRHCISIFSNKFDFLGNIGIAINETNEHNHISCISFCAESLILAVAHGFEIHLYLIKIAKDDGCASSKIILATCFVTLSNESPINSLVWKDHRTLIALGENITIWESSRLVNIDDTSDVHLLPWMQSYFRHLPELITYGIISGDGKFLAFICASGIHLCELEYLFPKSSPEYAALHRPIFITRRLVLPGAKNYTDAQISWNRISKASTSSWHFNTLMVKFTVANNERIVALFQENHDLSGAFQLIWYKRLLPKASVASWPAPPCHSTGKEPIILMLNDGTMTAFEVNVDGRLPVVSKSSKDEIVLDKGEASNWEELSFGLQDSALAFLDGRIYVLEYKYLPSGANGELSIVGRLRSQFGGLQSSNNFIWSLFESKLVLSSDKIMICDDIKEFANKNNNQSNNSTMLENYRLKALKLLSQEVLCGISRENRLLLFDLSMGLVKFAVEAEKFYCLSSRYDPKASVIVRKGGDLFSLDLVFSSESPKFIISQFTKMNASIAIDFEIIGGVMSAESRLLYLHHIHTNQITIAIWPLDERKTQLMDYHQECLIYKPIILAHSSVGDVVLIDGHDLLTIISLEATSEKFFTLYRFDKLPRPLGACFMPSAKLCWVITTQGLYVLERSIDDQGQEVWIVLEENFDFPLGSTSEKVFKRHEEAAQIYHSTDDNAYRLIFEMDGMLLEIPLPNLEPTGQVKLQYPWVFYALNLLNYNQIHDFFKFIEYYFNQFELDHKHYDNDDRLASEDNRDIGEDSSQSEIIIESFHSILKVKETSQSIDVNGAKYLILLELPMKSLGGLQFLAAFHSDSQDRIFDIITSTESLSWERFKELGIALWCKNGKNLQRSLEKVARTEFKDNPLLALLIYLLLGRRTLLKSLMRNIRDEDVSKLSKAVDSEEPDKQMILRNAYHALSRRKFLTSIFLFLIGDCPTDALSVAYRKLHDLHLGCLIGRLSATEDIYIKSLKEFLNFSSQIPLPTRILLGNYCGSERRISNCHFDKPTQLLCVPLALENLGYEVDWQHDNLVLTCAIQLSKTFNFETALQLLDRNWGNQGHKFEIIKAFIMNRRALYDRPNL